MCVCVCVGGGDILGALGRGEVWLHCLSLCSELVEVADILKETIIGNKTPAVDMV